MTEAPGGTPRAARATTRRAAAGVVLRWLLPLLVLGGFAAALWGRWGEVGEELQRLEPGTVAGVGVLALTGVLASFATWRAVLADLGSRVPAAAGARIFFVGQLGKYLPGSVWPVVVQMRMATRLGIPRSRIGLTFAVTLGLSVTLGLVVGLWALPTLVAGQSREWLWLLLPLPALAVFLHPRPLNAALQQLLRVARRPRLERPLSGRGMLVAAGTVLLFWLLGGLHVWLLAVDLGADPLRALPVAIGGFALAFCAGPLLVVFPAGAGVREALLVVLLSSVLATPSAVAVALVSRFVLAAVDGLLAVGAVLADR